MSERNTSQMGTRHDIDVQSVPMATATTIEAGKMVCYNAAGYAVEGAVSTTLKAIGRAEESVTNSGANGAVQIRVRRGVFQWANSGTDAIDRTDLENDCFIEDDETVSSTDDTGARSKAGKVIDVDSGGVWVQTGARA